MSNLIDRKVLLREMEKLYNERAMDAYMTGDKEIRVTWNDAVYLVTIAPTLEAEPVKHGRWVAYEFGNERWHKCSVCGVADEYINSFGLEAIRNYCPYCGARMDLIGEDKSHPFAESVMMGMDGGENG